MKLLKVFLAMSLGYILVGCTTVGPGERGVRITFGKTQKEVLESGIYYWIPFASSVRKISVQTQKAEIPESEAVALGNQKIDVHIVVNYQIDPKDVVNIVEEFGDELEAVDRVLVPNVHEVLKQATAKKTVEEVLSKRTDLKNEVDKTLIERLSKYGIKVRDISIVNLKFSKEFTDSVERKMVAEQEAKQAEYLAEKAKNEATALVNLAKGQADAQVLLKASITPMILQKMAIEKWNGNLPMVVGNGTTPILDLKGLSVK